MELFAHFRRSGAVPPKRLHLIGGRTVNTTINHLNLATANVASLMRFFEGVFGFRVLEQRGNGSFAILLSGQGFVLTLMHDKTLVAAGYPKTFHLGFLQPDQGSVHSLYQRIVDLGFSVPEPHLMRGDTFGFYVTPSDGVVVEVSTSPYQRNFTEVL